MVQYAETKSVLQIAPKFLYLQLFDALRICLVSELFIIIALWLCSYSQVEQKVTILLFQKGIFLSCRAHLNLILETRYSENLL